MCQKYIVITIVIVDDCEIEIDQAFTDWIHLLCAPSILGAESGSQKN